MNDNYPDLFKFEAVQECLKEIDQQTKPELESLIKLACLLEVAAFKPGNVHPDASFENSSYQDFVKSAIVTSPILAQAESIGVGQSILNGVKITREKVGHNTNLGILLLMAPICAVPSSVPLKDGINDLLNCLSIKDSQCVHEAICLSDASGLGKVSDQDVSDVPEIPLRELMKLAVHRDRIASEYHSGYSIILNDGIEILNQSVQMGRDWQESIQRLHLELMSRYADTLISRKCGQAVADQSAILAKEVLSTGWPETESGKSKFMELDRWLRSDGHRRNPGTTADFVAAILLAGFRDKLIPIPTGNFSS